MVFEYTQQEKEQILSIHRHYMTLITEKEAELQQHGKNTKIYARLLAERDELESNRIAEIAVIYEQAEQDRFNAFNGDIDAISQEAHKQVPLIVERHIASDLVKDEQSGDFITRYKKEGKPVLSSREARTLIYKGIALFTDYLKENAPQKAKDLDNYISKHVSTSPYIYIKKSTIEAEEAATNIRKPLPAIETYGFMNDKISKEFINGGFTQQDDKGKHYFVKNVRLSALNAKTEVIAKIGFSFDDKQGNLPKNINGYDNAVMSAIGTACHYYRLSNPGKPLVITPQEIWRLMNGTQDASKNPSAGQVKRVCESMDKMRFTPVLLDLTEEISKRKISFEDVRLKSGHIDTYFIKADKISFTTEKNNEVVGYRIDAEPILYAYNAAKKHILYIPLELLDTSQKTGNEGSTIEIRNYLLHQIKLMYGGHRNSNRLLYETMYSSTGLDTPENRLDRNNYKDETAYKRNVRKEAQKDRDKVNGILEAWKAKGYIKGFTQVKKGNGYIGVEIDLHEKEPKKFT